jgi:transposase
MPQDSTKHVGLDEHQKTIAVGVADAAGGAGRFWGTIPHTAEAVVKLVRQLGGPGVKLQFWCEAGPCGYGLYRQLLDLGQACTVVAPALIPRKAGDRIKTDRRDAVALARLGRAGELTGVWVPGVEQEAMRDLLRCREDAKSLQRQTRQQLGSFLLRQSRIYTGGQKKWTQRFTAWLDEQQFALPVTQQVFGEYRRAVDQASARVADLERQIAQTVQEWTLWPVVQALMALRGIDLLTAATVRAELGNLTRFPNPRQLMAYLGLVPSEHSSGQSQRRGGITKTGNAHARRVLVEASWAYRFPARQTAHLRRKARGAPEAAQAIAWKAQKRLCGRYRHLIDRGKLQVQACTAVARELVGFIWAIVQAVGMPPDPGSRCGEPSVTL